MISTTCYLEEEQVEQLRLLADRTKVSAAEWVRQGIELALEANGAPGEVISEPGGPR